MINHITCIYTLTKLYSCASHAALSGSNACSRVYPNVTHLLCRWHVDKYGKNLVM